MAGYSVAETLEEADAVFMNTCSIRDNAEQKILNRLEFFHSMKKKKKHLIVGVLGCMAERVKDTGGTAAIVCFPGIMYRGGAEQKIRKYLIDNNFIDCIIQLPSNLFFGTSIATCIMVLKKRQSRQQDPVY